MRVLVFVKADADSEAGVLPTEEALREMNNFNEELVKAGIMLDGAGLRPSVNAARVHFTGTRRTVVDGPFAETKELVAGYWLWEVRSMDEAIEWAKRCPNPMNSGGTLEIRPLFEDDDFGEAFTPELRAQEHAILAKAQELKGDKK